MAVFCHLSGKGFAFRIGYGLGFGKVGIASFKGEKVGIAVTGIEYGLNYFVVSGDVG